MTEAELRAIEARAKAATKGSWIGKLASLIGLGVNKQAIGTGRPTWADLEFIEHSHDDIPALCAEVRCLRGQVRRLRQHAAISDKPSIVHVKDAEHPRITEQPPLDQLTGAQVEENK